MTSVGYSIEYYDARNNKYQEPTWCTNFFNMFIALLYMFRATMFPSSGENTIPLRHLVLVTLQQVDSLKLQGFIS